MASSMNCSSGGLSFGGALMKRSFRMSPVPLESNACRVLNRDQQVSVEVRPGTSQLLACECISAASKEQWGFMQG